MHCRISSAEERLAATEASSRQETQRLQAELDKSVSHSGQCLLQALTRHACCMRTLGMHMTDIQDLAIALSIIQSSFSHHSVYILMRSLRGIMSAWLSWHAKCTRICLCLCRMSAQVADLKASSRAAALQAMQKAAVGDQAQGQQQHGLSMAGGSLTHLGAVSVYG